ncbi:hypothetical protein Q9299_07820 [Gemmobacter fulvus]|uniref:hypothetical protein n=1 Tax=Gemmobacter fulvus TaxID=2840474 RepID=UPI002796A19E|nr:hypothetical protein [Gemmobacter fulvus]MDQ1848193.1 hypothetical protein [Gemmobacter fulvus]
MAKFQWMTGNGGFYGFDRFGDFSEISRTVDSMVLKLEPAAGQTAQSHAARIEMSFVGYRSYLAEDGPMAGREVVTGGRLISMRYVDASGDVLMDATGLAVRLPTLMALFAASDGYAAWRFITSGSGHQFIGAETAARPGAAGSGDVIETGWLADSILAGGGDDYLVDRGGADSYAGGTGVDTLSFASWTYSPWLATVGVTADLLKGSAIGPDGAVDTLGGIEAVEGSFLDDVLRGDRRDNVFVGLSGADVINGRGGFDMVKYAAEARQGGTDGIRANLTLGTIRDGFGTTDRVQAIEGVEGTARRDVFIDNGGDNYFAGLSGADEFRLGRGDDTVQLGGDADLVVLTGSSFGDDTVEDFSVSGGDVIRFEQVTAFSQITLSTVWLDGLRSTLAETAQGSVTLQGVVASSLTASDFGF